MALSGIVRGVAERTTVRLFRPSEAERVFGSRDVAEIRKTVGKAAAALWAPPVRLIVDALPFGVLVTWYWER